MRIAAFTLLTALAAALAGCSRLPERPLIPVPPATLEGGWQRVTLDTPPAAEAGEPLRALKPTQRVRATYRLNGVQIGVDAYAMPSQASAFEAQQKWRAQAGTLGFHNGNVFVVCSSESAGQAELIAFSRLLERTWPGAPR